MGRTVTAIYSSHAMGRPVRAELVRIGIRRDHIAAPSGARIVPNAAEASGSATTRGNLEDAVDRLHDLHLSESDTHIHQQAIWNGDYVVSYQRH